MTWDSFGTLRQALWIGGGQWAGKSSVANLFAHRFGLTAYQVAGVFAPFLPVGIGAVEP